MEDKFPRISYDRPEPLSPRVLSARKTSRKFCSFSNKLTVEKVRIEVKKEH